MGRRSVDSAALTHVRVVAVDIDEIASSVLGPLSDGGANGPRNGGRDQPKPVAGEARGGGAGPAVHGAVACTVARAVALQATQHPDRTAVDTAEDLRDEQFDAVASLARLGVVTGVRVNSPDARGVNEGGPSATRAAPKHLPVEHLGHAAEREIVPFVGGGCAAVGVRAVTELGRRRP